MTNSIICDVDSWGPESVEEFIKLTHEFNLKVKLAYKAYQNAFEFGYKFDDWEFGFKDGQRVVFVHTEDVFRSEVWDNKTLTFTLDQVLSETPQATFAKLAQEAREAAAEAERVAALHAQEMDEIERQEQEARERLHYLELKKKYGDA